MTALQLEVLEAFRAIDIPEDKAARAAAALSSAYAKFEADIGTDQRKRDAEIGRDVSEVRKDVTDIRKDVAELRKDVADVRDDITSVKLDVADLRKDVKLDIADVRKEITGIKMDIVGVKGEVALQRWMLGFNITLTLLGFGSVLGFLWRFVK